jgi:hypothetical protein
MVARTQKMYLAQRLVKQFDSDAGLTMRADNPSEGLLGVLPVFSTKAAARSAYGRGVKLREIELDPEG